MNNNRFERFVINYYGDLPKILKNIDVHIQHNGLFLCPMHDNYNTPAAKIFKDSTGWAFYCFAEQRQFGTYDVYKEVYRYNMRAVFRELWNRLSESQRELMKDRFGEYDDSGEIACEQSYQSFYNRKINYQQLINDLCEDLKQD